jgi:hypothetical protein
MSCAALVFTGAACSGQVEGEAELGQVQQAVANGTDTGATLYTNVAALGNANGYIGCSSVLVGPKHVVTAGHCVVGTGSELDDSRAEDAMLTFDHRVVAGNVDPAVPAARRFRHTMLGSGKKLSLANPGFSIGSGVDIAVIPLDGVVPSSIATPAPVVGLAPQNVCTYGSPLLNPIVGFGRRIELPTNPASPRNYGLVSGVVREAEGDLFEYIVVRPSLSAPYSSTLPFDSGGGLFSANGTGTVCAITSWYNTGELRSTGHSGLDSAPAQSFMRSAIIDPKNGLPYSTCTAPAGSVDTDGDSVPDLCDNCPSLSNPSQTDSDGDGIGDNCDNCRLTPSPDQTNTNLVYETGSAPGNGPINLVTQAADPTYLTTFYPGDLCDSKPMTRLNPRQDSARPANRRPSSRLIDCTVNCAGVNSAGVCDASVGNTFDLSSFVGRDDNKQERRLAANTRMLRCACLPGESETACSAQTRCPRTNVTSPPAQWKTMNLLNARGTSAAVTTSINKGATTYVSTIHAPGQNFVQPATWAYGAETDLQQQLPSVGLGTKTSSQLPGTSIIAWSLVQNYFFCTGTSCNPPNLLNTVNSGPSLRQSTLRMEVTESVSTVPGGSGAYTVDLCKNPSLADIPRVFPFPEAEGCVNCGKFGWIEFRPLETNAFKTLFSNGTLPGLPITVDANILRANTDSNVKLVMGSEATMWATGQKRRGAIVQRNYPLVAGKVSATMAADPAAWGSQAIGADYEMRNVMSMKRQDVAYFNRKQSDGSMLQGYYVHDFDLNAMRYESFNGAYVLKDIQSVTYRAEDDAYYLLDRDVTANKVLLYRLPRGNVPELIGSYTLTTSSLWQIYTGARGELLVSAQKSGSTNVALIELSQNADDTWTWKYRLNKVFGNLVSMQFGMLSSSGYLSAAGTLETGKDGVRTVEVSSLASPTYPALTALTSLGAIF